MAHHPIPGTELSDEPYTALTQVALGLTLYLDEPLFWAQHGARRALEAFLARAPSSRVEWYTTSSLTTWQRASQESAALLAEHLSNPMLPRVRHLFAFELVDDTDVPTTSFVYREYDSARGGARASTLEVLLPQETDPRILLELAAAIGQIGPWWSGTGGYLVSWNRWERNGGLTMAHGLAQRYLGLDVQHAEVTSWVAVEGLPSTSWLTMIGKSLAGVRAIDLAALAAHPWVNDVTVRPVGNGALIRAGGEPTDGDRNRLEYPYAYAEVARALAGHFVDEPPELGGLFYRLQDTRAWQRRFLEPEGWNSEEVP
jgi:hypothetical protein